MNSVSRCRDCGRELTAHGVCPVCSSAVTSAGAGFSGGARAQSAAWREIGERLADAVAPKYEIVRFLGYGGMAGVYLAHEVNLARPVAIKVMAPALMMDDGLVARFRQEARTTAKLNHSNIVTVYDVGEENGLFFYSMRYVAGRSVADVMPGLEKPLEFPIIQHWLTEVGNALDYAHHSGVTHRDIKPSNILLNAQGDALVTDFGIAKVVDEPSLTQTGVLVGTPAYMSPEQCSSGAVTGASDQYSLGAVAYLLITGKPVFSGPTAVVLQRQLSDTPEPILSLRPDCPPRLAEVVDRMLVKNPADRFGSIGEAIEAMGPTHLSRNHALRARLTELSATVAELKLQAGASSVQTGEVLELSAVAYDGTGRPLRRETHWLTSDPLIARIREGRLEALSTGQVMVTARCERAEDSLVIQIIPVPLDRLDVGPAPAQVHPGDTFLLEATPLSPSGQVLPDRVVDWSSDDTNVVAVSSGGRVEAKTVGSATVWARCEEQAVPVEVAVTMRPVADISVQGARDRLTVGETLELAATPRAADGSPLDDRRVEWRSTEPKVLRIKGDGRLEAVGVGAATVEIRADDRVVSLEIEVRPVPVHSVEVVSPPSSLVKGETWTGTAVALDAEGSRLEGREFRWMSTNPDVAVVDADGSLRAVGAGRATITASSGVAADSFVLQVEQRPVAQLELKAPQTSLQVGETVSLEVSARSSDGDYLEDRTMVWTSGNPDVARVGAAGVVEGLKPGVATITATCGRAAKSLVIQVFPIPVHHIDLSGPLSELEVGDRVGLTASAMAATGEKLAERSIVWSSSDLKVVTVDDSGFVEAVGEGHAAITAACEGVEASARVSVRDPAAEVTEVFVPPVRSSEGADRTVAAPLLTSPPSVDPVGPRTAERPSAEADAAPVAANSAGASAGDGRRWGLWLGLGGAVVAALVLVSLFLPGGDSVASPASGEGGALSAAADSVAGAQEGETAVAGAGVAEPGGEVEETDSVASLSDPSGGETAAVPETVAGGPSDATTDEAAQPSGAAPAPTTGTVEVVGGLPNGATVMVSGQDLPRRGVTGGEIELPPGTYRFEFAAPGYEARSTEVTVTAGGSHTVSGTLNREAPQEGTVRLGAGLPTGGVVTVSGSGLAARALTAGPISLPPGQYRVEAEAPGFQPASESITVVSGRETVYSPNLQALPEDPPEPVGPTPASVAPQLQAVFMALATVVEGQDLDAATSAFPGATSWFQQILPVFQEDQARSVSVTVGSMGEPVLSDGGATVNIDLDVMFQDIRNRGQNLPQELVAVFRQEGAAWVLSRLTRR
ncbi:MAG: protein kinase [Gemmatimonadetes bacterium]|nr:protein kinase [Gemmatimonadota bacterium]